MSPSGLTDADLAKMADVFDPSSGGADHRVSAALRELIALRACRAQDTPSDPAAFGLAYPENGHLSVVELTASAAEDWMHEDDDRLIVPLYRDRAPGAVAAAPTEDEVTQAATDLMEALTDQTTYAEGALDRTLDRHAAGWRLVPPAPSAGEDGQRRTRGLLRSAWLESDDWRSRAERLARLLVRDRVALARVKAQRDASDRTLLAAPSAGEDEAAVERAARAVTATANLWRWSVPDDVARRIAGAALAAARGPRTQDDTTKRTR